MSNLSREEFLALNAIAKSRRELMFQTFNGTQLKFGKFSYAKGNWHGMATGIYEFQGMIQEKVTEAMLPKIQEAAQAFAADAAGVGNFNELVAALGQESAGQLLKEIIPWVGLVYTTINWAKASKQVITDAHHLYRIKAGDFRSGFRDGTPQAAVDSVQQIIKRELYVGGIDWANQTVGFGTKVAGVFIDMGTATTLGPGIATFIADWLLKLTVIGMDIKQMKAGNRWLQNPGDLSIKVFEECPILGCYLLISADTSSVANLFVADIGLPNWMTQVEQMYESKIEPTVRYARDLVDRSNLQLEGVSGRAQPAKTHVKKDFFLKSKAKAAKDYLRAHVPHRSSRPTA
ncbi:MULTISPECIES: hypothetical protein [Lysobacter]|uniref:Uncharacterized protein n=2 Tax=Lysobacter TaxID=68 RepID=A0A0S2DHB1_LYSEN|nr:MULTISPECIES: hypothetical protein [Lysobacter]ALN57929.1 hypothetical protein GLE_2580 [Lysobacter enzymogenes]QCW26437.1 hypothetical protein FE772_12945 [Lysobacter enzymogenes]QQQ04094.1 hypothetical protein JHW41_12550 [Lysobacter enzymogenes]UZW58413.1 hypothetical protein BV903_013895 [Lysobacter enzymogenes]WMT02126.1 hypothetical protein RDV84_19485 [Lysobacter yananisis]